MTEQPSPNAIAIQAGIERLRQERETFDLNKAHAERWFALRLRMGYIAVVLLPSIAAVCGFIVLNPGSYSGTAVTAASGTLFVDMVGLVGAVFKVVLTQSSVVKLAPVTASRQQRGGS